MPNTRGGANKRRRFAWHYHPQLERITTTSEHGIVHTYRLDEIQHILQHLADHFGDAFFPLANNVQKLGADTERPGLGTAILAQQPGDTYHAQGASYLGVVLEQAGYFEWNRKQRGIAWRVVDHGFGSHSGCQAVGRSQPCSFAFHAERLTRSRVEGHLLTLTGHIRQIIDPYINT